MLSAWNQPSNPRRGSGKRHHDFLPKDEGRTPKSFDQMLGRRKQPSNGASCEPPTHLRETEILRERLSRSLLSLRVLYHRMWARFRNSPAHFKLAYAFLAVSLIAAPLAVGLHLVLAAVANVPLVAYSAGLSALLLIFGGWGSCVLGGALQGAELGSHAKLMWASLVVVSLGLFVLNLFFPLTLPSTAGALVPAWVAITPQLKSCCVMALGFVYALSVSWIAALLLERAQFSRSCLQPNLSDAEFAPRKAFAWGLALGAASLPPCLLLAMMGVHPLFMMPLVNALITAPLACAPWLFALVVVAPVLAGLLFVVFDAVLKMVDRGVANLRESPVFSDAKDADDVEGVCFRVSALSSQRKQAAVSRLNSDHRHTKLRDVSGLSRLLGVFSPSSGQYDDPNNWGQASHQLNEVPRTPPTLRRQLWADDDSPGNASPVKGAGRSSQFGLNSSSPPQSSGIDVGWLLSPRSPARQTAVLEVRMA